MKNVKLQSATTEFKEKVGFFNWLFSKDDYREYVETLKLQPSLSQNNLKK